MKIFLCHFFALLAFLFPSFTIAEVKVGIGKTDMTPPIGTPSAGYFDRNGSGMQGVHDPLCAVALFIDNLEKKVVLCSVDNLGFTYEMVQQVIEKVHAHPDLKEAEVFIGSSHTHSGGGAYLDIPVLGKTLAGEYNPKIKQLYIDKTAEAILQAYRHQISAKVGIGYGMAKGLSEYRGSWPKESSSLEDVAVIKITDLEDKPFAVFFNFPVHPTLLRGQNRLFSADFVGYARESIESLLGNGIVSLYFNGAQGDVNPVVFNEKDRFDACSQLGRSLAESVKKIWDRTFAADTLEIATQKDSYSFYPESTMFRQLFPQGYQSEMNIIVLNRLHAFITVPGELSSFYDRSFKQIGLQSGFEHVSILGLTNDAHGYIIPPQCWLHKAFETNLSFGGKDYGDKVSKKAELLLKAKAP